MTIPTFHIKYPSQQSDPPLSPKETLPTMYDLPSENPEEPGLPDEFHDLQPQLLSTTFRPPTVASDQVFCGTNMNLYYDVHHQNWYKRPDWFAVLGVPRLYEGTDLRLSYVIWQEGINPAVVVEFLSPGTEDEDLGETTRDENRPPVKWEVYEQILHIPYYIVFSRYTNELQVFVNSGGRYQAMPLNEPRAWLPNLELGLRLWQGEYRGINRLWLRWYDGDGNWLPTEAEAAQQQAEEAQQQAEEAQQQAERERQRVQELEAMLARYRDRFGDLPDS